MNISGDVIIDKVQYRVEPLYIDNSAKMNLALMPSTFYNPIIPFNHDISGKIVPGFMVYVSGRPGSFPFRFKFEFKDDTKVFFQFDVRFDECTVVRNHRDNGWAKEERDLTHFPFSPGVGFDMIFYVRDVDFMVAVNGQHFVNFTHRLLPLSDIKYFNINGDVAVTSLRFCD
ncbi:galectin-8-like protein [Leptotrombidium deliense]|uniref:Galectin n=1 Tax=Leptotrombidium deliense TaxID=299467 RepID=A0A443S469_9ACAR|nr:galectin-8-like protein [Leptotrombidium deliense]